MAALTPTILAIWALPCFVTQDGPAHLYNSWILYESIEAKSILDDVFEVSWRPLPNWAGHLGLTSLMLLGVSPWIADRITMTITLVGFAAAITWMQRRIQGGTGSARVSILSATLAMNLAWLLGFTSFLLGACLFPVALGSWWSVRLRPGPKLAGGLGCLVITAYFAHLVSMGLIVLAVIILLITTRLPDESSRRRLIAWTLLGLTPVMPLVGAYLTLAARGGSFQLEWIEFNHPASWYSWWTRILWIDPLTIGSRKSLPFLHTRSGLFALSTPTLWILIGLAGFLLVTIQSTTWRIYRAFLLLSILMLLGGLLGPDTFGEQHGGYLTQRVVLFGLIAMVPWFDWNSRGLLAKISTGCLALAWLVQTGFVWDYALKSDRAVRSFIETRRMLRPGDRIGILLIDMKTEFRANPVRHAGTLLGIESQAIVWSNYEAAHYYFPVRIRPQVSHPPVLAFEEISLCDDPASAHLREAQWEALLSRHHASMDLVIVRGQDPDGLDRITRRWFELDSREGELTIYRRQQEKWPAANRGDRTARAGRNSSRFEEGESGGLLRLLAGQCEDKNAVPRLE